MPLNGTDQNGEPTQLPQFNLSPSGHHDSPDKEEMDMEDEEKDTMGDMPDVVEPLMSFSRQPTGLRMHSLTHSATRLGRLNSSMRAASSLQKSFSNMNNSAGHSQFKAQVGPKPFAAVISSVSWQPSDAAQRPGCDAPEAAIAHSG